LAVIICTGTNSQWGRIKAGLVMDSEDTPLQARLAQLTTSIGSIGVGFAMAIFVALIINASILPNQTPEGMGTAVINAFIMGVIVIVIAVPEGLPLAVTISLAYSSMKVRLCSYMPCVW
jgi:Ca2+-transporting ATPase